MKILFIGSGCACRLPFVEKFFKKHLQEADVDGIEIGTADMEAWRVTSKEHAQDESSGPDKVGNLLGDADFIVVMEKRQRNFLTRFMDYNSWGKIHLFSAFCTNKSRHESNATFGDIGYQTQDEVVNDGCTNLLNRIKKFLSGDSKENKDFELAL